MEDLKKFSHRVRSLAAHRHLSQTAIARHCGVTPQSAQRWFSGASYPRPKYLRSLAGALGISVDQLVEGIAELERQVIEQTAQQELANGGAEESAGQIETTFERYYRLREQLDDLRRSHRRALNAAVYAAQDVLLENLLWAGYDRIDSPNDRPGSSVLQVEGAPGDRYAIDVRVDGISPRDGVRYQWATEDGIKSLIAYAYQYQRDAQTEVHFLMFTARELSTEQGKKLLREAASWVSANNLMANQPTPEHRDNDPPPPPQAVLDRLDKVDLASFFVS